MITTWCQAPTIPLVRFLNFLLDAPCNPEKIRSVKAFQIVTHSMKLPHRSNPTPSDPINRLAEVIVGMNNRPSAQTLMVRPVSTTTLTFDGKSEKMELFEDLFHTTIRMQPDMTEARKTNHFNSVLNKNAIQNIHNINTANGQTLEVILAVFRRK